MPMQTFLSTAETAARLGITARQVQRLVEGGRLSAAVKLPGLRGAYVFDADAVETLKAERAAQ